MSREDSENSGTQSGFVDTTSLILNVIGHFHLASFHCNYQNPTVVSFLMLIRTIVVCCPLGLQNLNLGGKTK